MGKVLPFLLILASLALGAAFGWYRAGMPDLRRRPGPEPVPRAEPPPSTKPQIPEAEPPPPPTPPLATAETFFQDLRFGEARTAFAELARGGRPEIARKARRMEVLSDILERATRGVPRRLGAEAPHEVTLANDRVLVGQVTTDEAGNVTLVTDQGIRASFSPGEVASVKRVETAAWRASREAELERRLRKVGRDTPPALDYFQAAYFCIRNGLADRAADLLLRSSRSEGFPLVVETFGGTEADLLLARWEDALRPAAAPVSRPPAVVLTGDALLRAEQLYKEGLVHYRKSWPGMKEAAEELKKARSLFDDARDAFEEAKRARPEDRRIDGRLQSVQTLLYDCIKRATL